MRAGSPAAANRPTGIGCGALWAITAADERRLGHVLRAGFTSIRSGDRCLSSAKAFFAYGLGNSVLFPLSAGAASILERVVFTDAFPTTATGKVRRIALREQADAALASGGEVAASV
jgi:acyl-coenzyme A synthetase/AMP-(fatty) acid ligase